MKSQIQSQLNTMRSCESVSVKDSCDVNRLDLNLSGASTFFASSISEALFSASEYTQLFSSFGCVVLNKLAEGRDRLSVLLQTLFDAAFSLGGVVQRQNASSYCWSSRFDSGRYPSLLPGLAQWRASKQLLLPALEEGSTPCLGLFFFCGASRRKSSHIIPSTERSKTNPCLVVAMCSVKLFTTTKAEGFFD